MPRRPLLAALALLVCFAACHRAAPPAVAPPAPPPTPPRVLGARPDGVLQLEAEDFAPTGPGWTRRAWGENLYASTFANTYLSRKAYLSAPARCPGCSARATVRVPEAGSYLVLARYEFPYRFSAAFRVRVEQGGVTLLDRAYGTRTSPKIFPFRMGVRADATFPWGATENIVWEGHEQKLALAAGEATITLVADEQTGDVAERNVDVLLLTRDTEDVAKRLATEQYLPLDGLLTQAGDVHLRVTSRAGPMTLTVPNGVEHSPYWVHQRSWPARTIEVAAGATSPWTEVGSLLDTLNDGQWTLSAAGKDGAEPAYEVELGVPDERGETKEIARFDARGATLRLAYDADTRGTGRVRRADDELYELLQYVRTLRTKGRAPTSTPVYALGFDAEKGDPRRAAAVTELNRLLGITAPLNDPAEPLERRRGAFRRGYSEVRHHPLAKLEGPCAALRSEKEAEETAVVSVGDEISLSLPTPDALPRFAHWLGGRGVRPSDLSLPSLDDVRFDVSDEAMRDRPLVYYWSRIFAADIGIAELARTTRALGRCFPRAGIGANFSPHPSAFLGSASQWITLFRRGGLTMPWTEDYAWMLPIASQELVGLPMDVLRAGVRGKPDARLHQYVMAHDPGNTPDSFRRLLFGAIAHGAKVLNLFEVRPVQGTYTENYVNGRAMYAAIHAGLHDLGTFDDLVQPSSLAPAKVALWYSQTGEAWNDHRAPFGAAKRTLWLLLQHAGLTVDVVDDEDALDGIEVLYLTDPHVSRAAARKLVAWARGGGRLVLTAGAGSLDEANRAGSGLASMAGFDTITTELAPEAIDFEKQDLPFAKRLDVAHLPLDGRTIDVAAYGARDRLTAKGAEVLGRFDDGTPAMLRRTVGKGEVTVLAFLPGLSYMQPALPRVPVDRTSRPGASAHFLPTEMDVRVRALVTAPAAHVAPAVRTSDPLVRATLLSSPEGAVVVLVNWRGTPVKALRIDVAAALPAGPPARASGLPIGSASGGSVILDLDVADAVVWRKP